MPSEMLEGHLENIAWIVLSLSLFIMTTSAMNRLMIGLEDQKLRATALLVKECLDSSWRTGCSLKVRFPSALSGEGIEVDVRTGSVIAIDGNRAFEIDIDMPVRDAVIRSGGTYRFVRDGGVVKIEVEGG
jgi:hypothetical protein